MEKPQIASYDDYRKFLGDYYRFLKGARRGFSFRSFAKDAGFSSPNFLKLVIDGKRNLTAESIQRFCQALKLSRQEMEVFDILVHFNQAQTIAEKNRHYERLRKLHRYRSVKSLEQSQYDYYSAWYHIAIRELTNLKDFEATPEWIAQKLLPKISTKNAADAIDLLLSIGMLSREPSGKLRPIDSTVTTGAEVKSLAVLNFHKEMLKKASDSLDVVPSLERDISSATLSVKESELPKLKDRIVRFRREILATFDVADATADRIYQLNIQLFPLSQKTKGDS